MQKILSEISWEWFEAAIAVVYVWIMRREVKRLKKDIDGVALAAKTKRAIAQKEIEDEKNIRRWSW